MSENRPTLYLHIGRNKAGSTTLQDYCAAHADWLAASGVEYVLFGRLCDPRSALRSVGDVAQLRALLGAGGRSVLVSDEIISAFPEAPSRRTAEAFRGLNTCVLLYVRPYRDWVRSSYGFDVRIGHNARDFDEYLRHIAPVMSFLPNLTIWGETLGWDRVRVRSTDQADLHRGSLVHDCLWAMGLQAPAGAAPEPVNAMPNWMAIELLRLAKAQDPGEGWSRHGTAVAEALHELAELALAERGGVGTGAAYLTQAQGRALDDLYNRDLAQVERLTGVALRPSSGAAAERPFLPSAAHIPRDVLRRVAERATCPDYARLHPEVAEFVVSPAFTALLDSPFRCAAGATDAEGR